MQQNAAQNITDLLTEQDSSDIATLLPPNPNQQSPDSKPYTLRHKDRCHANSRMGKSRMYNVTEIVATVAYAM